MESFHNAVVHIPIFEMFKTHGLHKFYMFNFSPKFDGLIGTDLLQRVNANIDMKEGKITIPANKIPLNYIPPETQFQITIPPRTQQIIRIPVNKLQGTGIIDYKKFPNNLEMPETLVTIDNHFAITSVLNPKETPLELTLTEPIDIELITEAALNYYEPMAIENTLPINQNELLKENF